MKRANKCVNKRPYAYKDDALKQIKKVYRLYKIKLRYYECPTCLDYHLTKVAAKTAFKKYQTEWQAAHKRRLKAQLIRQIVEKQYREFKRLFNKYCKDNGLQNKKPPTILKGILPREERLQILVEMKKPLWRKILHI